MPDIDSHDRLRDVTWLRDNPVGAHLGSDEAVEHVLTNREVGLRRGPDGERTQVSPGEAYGAIAALTDRRVLFLVGAPPERDGDLVESVPYEAIEGAVAETETLTQRVLLETAATTYAFTARETDAVEAVQSFFETAASVYSECEEILAAADHAAERLSIATDEGDWEGCADAEQDARATLERATDLVEGTPFAPLGDRIVDLGAEVDALASLAHQRQAAELADESERLLVDHEYEASHAAVRSARDHVDLAESLVEADAAADGGTTVDVRGFDDAGLDALTGTQERIEELSRSIQQRPIEDADSYVAAAEEAADRDTRIDALESAVECYRSAATLLADDDSPFEGDETAVRADAERVIDDLVTAHFEAARGDRSAGEWERDAENPPSAFELLTEARDHAERALELARAYPPGDVASIEEELERVTSVRDPLRIEVELSDAEDSAPEDGTDRSAPDEEPPESMGEADGNEV